MRMRLWENWIWLGLLLFSTHAFTQTTSLFITDQEGTPLEGVTVYSTIQEKHWYSDKEGKVSLRLANPKDSVILSYFGFETRSFSSRQLPRVIQLAPLWKDLTEVIVTGRRNDPLDQAIQEIALLSVQEIQLRQSNSTPEMLEQSGEVFVQRSQFGGGSPILRGFEANRIVLVIDGVRLNNAIYRSGHLQNAMTLAPQSLQRTEVILGPGSLLYGSDALGGVIHFRTKEVPLQLGGEEKVFRGEGGYQFASAARASTAYLQMGYGSSKWGGFTSLNASIFGDLRSGKNRPDEWPDFGERTYYVERVDGIDSILPNSNPEIQRLSGYSQLDLIQKVRFRPHAWLDVEGNFQFSTSSNIPRYDALTETRRGQPRFAEWYYGPQTRILSALTATHRRRNSFYDRARFQLSFQFVEEDRINRMFRDDWREINEEDVFVGGFTADFDRRLGRQKEWSIQYGGELQFNQVNSNARQENLVGGEEDVNLNTRYPGGENRFWQGGLYGLLRWVSRDSVLQLEGGVRYSFTRLLSRFSEQGPIEWPIEFLSGIRSFNQALTGSFGLHWQPGSGWSVHLLSATAFRAPNLDDSGKIRESGGFISVPNPDLQPENAWTNELRIQKSWAWNGHYLRIAGGAFYTRVEDLMTRTDYTLPNGDAFFVSRGDTLFVQANVNADQGRIWGGTTRLKWQLRHKIEATWTQTFTLGRKKLADPLSGSPLWVPLEHIPPLFGRLSLKWMPGAFRFEAALRYQGAKRLEDYGVLNIVYDDICGRQYVREGSSDNLENGLVRASSDPCGNPYHGLYAWTSADLYASWQPLPWIGLDLAVENALDTHYRTFSSGISAAGRNWKAGLRLSW